MILSKQKPWEEIAGYLDKDNSVFIMGCNGCAQASGSGGPEQVKKLPVAPSSIFSVKKHWYGQG